MLYVLALRSIEIHSGWNTWIWEAELRAQRSREITLGSKQEDRQERIVFLL